MRIASCTQVLPCTLCMPMPLDPGHPYASYSRQKGGEHPSIMDTQFIVIHHDANHLWCDPAYVVIFGLLICLGWFDKF